MIAASKLQSDPDLDSGNVFVPSGRPALKLLRVAALYGANASGKSNIGLALSAFLKCVAESANLGFQFLIDQFRLDTVSHREPIFFEMIFLREGVQYRYGFEVRGDAGRRE